MHTSQQAQALWNFKGYWTPDHTYGQCLISPEETAFLIHIPKNASWYCKQLLHDWRPGDYINEDVSKMQCLLPLRDPVERWISGIADFLTKTQTEHLLSNPDGVFANFIDQIKVFDNHQEKQIYFIQNIDTNQLTCFNVDKDLHKNLTGYINKTFTMRYDKVPEDTNKTANTAVTQFYDKKFSENPNLVKNLVWKYMEDYQMISHYKDLNLFYEE